jgi:SAM-dependent methyltransferase
MTLPNWFEPNSQAWDFVLSQYDYKNKPIKALQIGAFSGDCSEFLLQRILKHPLSVLFDVDTWEGSWEHDDLNFNQVERHYDTRLFNYIEDVKLVKNKMTSDEFFKNNTMEFDFIYIDGDHVRDQVARDAENAYKVLKSGGIMVFDDYTWGLHSAPESDIPFFAIGQFLTRHRELNFNILSIHHQVWIIKN